MRNRKALGDDDPTIRDMVTPDMRRTVTIATKVRAEQRWSVVTQIAAGVILPTAVALGWWIGAQVPAVTVPAPTTVPTVIEQVATVPSDAPSVSVPGETIPVVAVTDLPLEAVEEKTSKPASRAARLRAKRKGTRPLLAAQ